MENSKCLGSGISTIRENTHGCADNCKCDTALYSFSILTKFFNIIIDRGISAPVHVREVVYGLNTAYKRFIFHLMSTVQLSGSERFDTQKSVQTATKNTHMSLAQEFQKHLSNASHKHVILDNGRHKKRSSKKRVQT